MAELRLRDVGRSGGLRFLGIGWRADRVGVLVIVAGIVGRQAVAGLEGLFLKQVADGLVARELRSALVAAVSLGVSSILADRMKQVVSYRISTLRDRARLLMERELRVALLGVPGIEHLENPEYHDKIALLRSGLRDLAIAAFGFLDGVGLFVRAVVTGLLLATVSPWLLLVVLAAPVNAWCIRRANRIGNDVAEELAESRRQSSRLASYISSGPLAKEIRATGADRVLDQRVTEMRAEIRRRRLATSVRTRALMESGSVVLLGATAAGVLFVLHRAMNGAATPGDVLLTMTTLNLLSNHVGDLGDQAGELLTFLRTLGRYTWLTDYLAAGSVRVVDPQPAPERIVGGISVNHIDFTYPGTDKPVLRGVSLQIPAGRTIALVGENGAGKTTLVKLLCGFYRPTAGSISVDGVDLSAIPPEDWRGRVTACFQDHLNPEFPFRDAVGIGDVSRLDDDGVGDAVRAAQIEGLVADLAEGLDTQLGRQFLGGRELSGGQWQQVALARSMMRRQPLLVVLDEPSSALDAVAERRLFERYAAAAWTTAAETGAVTVLVSHRFSSARAADVVVVLDGGEVIESGTHEELVALGGRYAELHELQARAYR